MSKTDLEEAYWKMRYWRNARKEHEQKASEYGALEAEYAEKVRKLCDHPEEHRKDDFSGASEDGPWQRILTCKQCGTMLFTGSLNISKFGATKGRRYFLVGVDTIGYVEQWKADHPDVEFDLRKEGDRVETPKSIML